MAAPQPPAARVPAAPRTLDALYLVNCLGVGGSERKVVRLANRLSARGTAAAVAWLNGPDTLLPMLASGVPRWHLDRRGKFSVPALRRLAALVREFRPRVLFAVNLYPALYAFAAGRLLRDGAPLLAALVNTTDVGRRDEWRKRIYKPLLRRFDAVVYGCAAQRDLWLDRTDTAWPRSRVVYNGVDLDEFDARVVAGVQSARAQRGYGADTFVIGSVGRLIEAKNHRVLVDAVAALGAGGIDARLIIAGEGPLREALQRHAARLGVGAAVTFTGNVDDVRPVLALMDVFVLPSLYIETFSNSALEAMAMRRPVVLSDAGGAAEMVRDGIDGRVIARAALARQLPRVLGDLARDPAARARMGAAARRRVEDSFSFDAMLDRYEQLIAQARHGRER